MSDAQSLQPLPPQTEKKRGGGVVFWLMLLVVAGLSAGWFFMNQGAGKAADKRGDAPVPVETALVEKGTLNVTLDALGSVTPLADVTVKPQISGQLMEIAFQEGQMVQQGDYLAQIDPRPYENALHQAEGTLAKDTAQMEDAQTVFERDKKLLAVHALSQQDFDKQKALLDQLKAAVQVDQAAIDTAKLNLSYCHIVSPVTGRVGLRQVDAGNYVQTNDTNGIVKITQVHPISVLFSVPEDKLPPLIARMKGEEAAPLVTAMDRTQSAVLATGKLASIDNQVDSGTGTVKMRALFDNENDALFPNQFVNVRILVKTIPEALIVPVAAVQRGANGPFVYVVADGKVTIRPIVPGPAEGEKTSVTEGLKEGERIVTDGTDKLADGTKVQVSTKNK